MKKILLLLLLAGTAGFANAQYSFLSTTNTLVKKTTGEKAESEDKVQIYNISLKDMLLVHNVFDEETGEMDSQIYQLTEVSQPNDDLITFQAKSGVSGKTYEYRLNMKDKENPALILVLANNDYNLQYNGKLTPLKTFKQ